MNLYVLKRTFTTSLVATTTLVSVLIASYFMLEPTIMNAGASAQDTFTVQQTIVGEISFVVAANDVTMSPSISGITGGTSNGTTTAVVRANNVTGYNMTIAFASTTAMPGQVSGAIQNYTPAVGGTPDYTFVTPTNSAEFAYTVQAGDLGDEAAIFRDDGGSCNTGAANSYLTCWYGISNATNTVTIINRSTATTVNGATTTINFRVGIDANPSPTVPSGIYNATATLTATEN